jgi:hypothetical protein
MKIIIVMQNEKPKGRDLTREEIKKVKDYYQKLQKGLPVPKRVLG